ncbi:hypothetical protein PISMIDRAFT_683279 [Pisolithus microcarpus 441]|uniref:Uncharacterized protein n=1 Tax=Pisolithus microcarpus 441 TaxID=765257 RepID=A0A0C9YZB2_9AGAM|nr:hypothetical protein PISMIDRAFT_683279 [Pisolithus microcarpus 441]
MHIPVNPETTRTILSNQTAPSECDHVPCGMTSDQEWLPCDPIGQGYKARNNETMVMELILLVRLAGYRFLLREFELRFHIPAHAELDVKMVTKIGERALINIPHRDGGGADLSTCKTVELIVNASQNSQCSTNAVTTTAGHYDAV